MKMKLKAGIRSVVTGSLAAIMMLTSAPMVFADSIYQDELVEYNHRYELDEAVFPVSPMELGIAFEDEAHLELTEITRGLSDYEMLATEARIGGFSERVQAFGAYESIMPLSGQPGNGFHNATPGIQRTIMQRTFHTPATQYLHFFQYNVTFGQEMLFLLNSTNIRSLILIDQWGGVIDNRPIQGTGGLIWTVDFTGTLFVIVDSWDFGGSYNLYVGQSDARFFGRALVNPSPASYNFGTRNWPNPGGWPAPVFYSQNLLVNIPATNQVPPNAGIVEIRLNTNNSGQAHNPNHFLLLATNQNTWIQQSAGLPMYSRPATQMQTMANQQMLIAASVNASQFFLWRPTLDMNFAYYMDVPNMLWRISRGMVNTQ